MGLVDELIESRSTFIINTILEQVRNDHEEETVHEDHQEEWEALAAREILAVVDRLKIVEEAEANALEPKSERFDTSIVLGALEKLLFGIRTQAPREWLMAEATKAQTIFWAAKIQMKSE